MPQLTLGLPKGSLEALTLELFRKSGWKITGADRSYFPSVDDDTLRDSTQRLVADEATTQEQAVMDRFVEERGHDGRAVEGLADTTSALRQGRVDHLLIAADGIENPIPIGPDPLDLATAPEVLEQVGVVATVRADAALVRAAAGNSADVHAVDQAGGLEGKAIGQAQDGVGALLRF